ncbi:MAG: hypothetical protein R3F56_04085 [Planctomycetota bacterium]
MSILLLTLPFGSLLAAQGLDLRLVSGGCTVSLATGQNQAIAPNTDVSNGYAIEAANGRGSFARSALVVSRAPDETVVRLTESSGFYAASSGQPVVVNRLGMSLLAPAPTRVHVDIACTWTYINQPFVTGSGTLVGAGFDIATGLFSGSLQERRDVDLPANTRVDLQFMDQLWWQTSAANIDWTVRVTAIPDRPCRPTTYGTGCGLTLEVGADLSRLGSQFAELRLRDVPVPGLVIVGLQRASVPIGPCVLHNDALIVLQVGAGRLYFDPPALPGLTFLLQGAALDGANLVASPGTQLTCS